MIVHALLFVSLHYYAGVVACTHAAVFALVLGTTYVVNGSNLLPPMVAHGVWDTVGI